MTITQTPAQSRASSARRRTGRALRALAAPLAVAGGMAIAAPMVAAPAATAAPLMSYAPTPLAASIRVVANRVYITVSGSGWPPHILITVTIASTPTVLGTTTTDSSGSFTFTGPLPYGLTAGNHTVTAYGGGQSASTVIYLAPGLPGVISPATVTSATPSSSGLAFTGADETLTASAGALAIGGGGMLVMASRKRKRKAWSA